jgi:hypothetical protein
MVPFVHNLDITDVQQVVEHFQNIPDITEYILESDLYPLAALGEALETLYRAKSQSTPENQTFQEYGRTITKIESVISTRIDYVNSIIEHLLGKESFEPLDFSLDNSPTREILSHIDLMKDVSHSSEINQKDYKAALRKFVKTLKFRFNKGLEIHKSLYDLEFEDIAEKQDQFPQAIIEEQKGFLEDALTMTRSHVPVTPTQIHQLKETLFKILEAMGVRILQTKRSYSRTEYCEILKEIEDIVIGLDVDFGQKLVKRFADMLPEYIAEHWNSHVIKHNRKVVELMIDVTDDAALLEDLYQVFINLTTAEAIQLQRKQELSRMSLKHIQTLQYVKNEENAQLVEMERFRNLDVSEKARELIRLSIYGLCEYLSKLSVEEFRKYPIGIVRSTEKVLRDLDQHRLKNSDIKNIQNSPEYVDAVETVKEALATYNSSDEKHNFVDIYKETDYTVDGVTYCVFNNIILRVIQNVTEAYFVVDSSDQNVSKQRLSELQITIFERYKTEWIRQNELQHQIEQEAMEELAGELV